MKRILTLNLKSVHYGGDNIGNKIQVEAEVLETFFELDKKIKLKHGVTTPVNRQIIRHVVDQNAFSFHLLLRVVEEDPVYNDIGIAEITIKVDLKSEQLQQSTHHVKVKESHGMFRKREAIFTFIFGVSVVEMFHHIIESEQGWVTVILSDPKKEESLPEYLKVAYEKTLKERDYFTIMEGWLRGRKASVKREPDGTSNLTVGYPHTGEVNMTYSISKRTLTVKGEKYLAEDDPTETWEKGVYNVAIPGSPHETEYPNALKEKVWFLVEYGENNRFIHMGSHSLGCITILDHDRWDNELYPILIKARKGNGIHIGTVKIID